MHPQVQRIRHRYTVDGVVVDHLFPGDGREVGEVRVVLDGVAAEVRGQVSGLGLEELRHLGDDRIGGDVQDVRELAAGDQSREFDSGIVGLRLDVDLEVDAELLVNRLPQRVGVQRGRRGAGRPCHDVDLAAATGRVLDGAGRRSRIVDEGGVDEAVGGGGQVWLDACDRHARGQRYPARGNAGRGRGVHGRGCRCSGGGRRGRGGRGRRWCRGCSRWLGGDRRWGTWRGGR